MFGQNPLVVYVTMSQIVALDTARARAIPWIIPYKWPNIDVALGELVKKTTNKLVDVILGEEISYISAFSYERGIPQREKVLTELRTRIPEIVTDATFDWMMVGQYVQTAVIAPEVYFVLQHAFSKFNLQIVTAQPICLILAERTQLIEKPALIIFEGPERIAILAQRGVVYECLKMSELEETQVSKLLAYSAKFYTIEPQAILFFTTNSSADLKLPDQYSVTKTVVDPMQMIAERRTAGKDDQILSIKMHKVTEPITEAAGSTPEAPPAAKRDGSMNKIWLIVAVIIAGWLVIGAILWVRSRQSASGPVQPVDQVQETSL